MQPIVLVKESAEGCKINTYLEIIIIIIIIMLTSSFVWL
jgi:hypothetical protein